MKGICRCILSSLGSKAKFMQWKTFWCQLHDVQFSSFSFFSSLSLFVFIFIFPVMMSTTFLQGSINE